MGNTSTLLTKDMRFIEEYLWTRHSDQEKNIAEGDTIVCPFTNTSKRLYWEVAFSAYRKQKLKSHSHTEFAHVEHDASTLALYLKEHHVAERAAVYAETATARVYEIGNIYCTVAPLIKKLSKVNPIVDILWNFLDAIGTLIVAIKDWKKSDVWAAGINATSATQLALGTLVFMLFNYAKQFQISALTHLMSTTIVGVVGAATSGVTFAAATMCAWALEHREVKLHEARIAHLDKVITQKTTELQKEEALGLPGTGYIEKLKGDLATLKDFREHQQKSLDSHKSSRMIWKINSAFMMAIAVVTIVIVALGASAATWGVALPAAASAAAFLVATLYNHKETVKKVATSVKTATKSLTATGLFSKPSTREASPVLNSETPLIQSPL